MVFFLITGFSDGTLNGAVHTAFSGGECSSGVKMVIRVRGGHSSPPHHGPFFMPHPHNGLPLSSCTIILKTCSERKSVSVLIIIKGFAVCAMVSVYISTFRMYIVFKLYKCNAIDEYLLASHDSQS